MTRNALLRAPGAWALVLVSLFFGGAVVARQLEGWIARVLRLESIFDREECRAEKIAMQHELVVERYSRRKAVARALSRGEVTLENAAAKFRELDRWMPEENWTLVRRRNPEATDAEFHCLTVIEFTKVYLAEDDPALAQTVEEKLGRELEVLRSRLVHALVQPGGERVIE